MCSDVMKITMLFVWVVTRGSSSQQQLSANSEVSAEVFDIKAGRFRLLVVLSHSMSFFESSPYFLCACLTFLWSDKEGYSRVSMVRAHRLAMSVQKIINTCSQIFVARCRVTNYMFKHSYFTSSLSFNFRGQFATKSAIDGLKLRTEFIFGT